MSKVIMMVSVELTDGNREDYLATTNRLRSVFESKGGIGYNVFANQGKDENSFTEMFTFNDMAAYEAFDESDDEETEANTLFAKIIGMAKRSPKYMTLLEIE